MKSQLGYLNVVGKSSKGFEKVLNWHLKLWNNFSFTWHNRRSFKSRHSLSGVWKRDTFLHCYGIARLKKLWCFFSRLVNFLLFLEPTILWKRERQSQPLNIDNKESELDFRLFADSNFNHDFQPLLTLDLCFKYRSLLNIKLELICASHR